MGYYSTSSTSDAAYIIGGPSNGEIIAEFKNDRWRQLGTLKKGRSSHGSIVLSDETMVIGGYSSDNRLAYFYYCQWFIDSQLSKFLVLLKLKSGISRARITRLSTQLFRISNGSTELAFISCLSISVQHDFMPQYHNKIRRRENNRWKHLCWNWINYENWIELKGLEVLT